MSQSSIVIDLRWLTKCLNLQDMVHGSKLNSPLSINILFKTQSEYCMHSNLFFKIKMQDMFYWVILLENVLNVHVIIWMTACDETF